MYDTERELAIRVDFFIDFFKFYKKDVQAFTEN